MSLYEALEELVGAGVLASAAALDIEVPAGVVSGGGKLVTLLRQRGAASYVTPLIDVLSREIWLGRDGRGAPYQVNEKNVRALLAVLEQHRPLPQDIAAAVEKAKAGVSGNAPGTEAPSRKIAANIFGRARTTGQTGGIGLADDVAIFLIERLFAHLLDDPGLLPGLKPAVLEYLAITAAPATPAVASPAQKPEEHARTVAAPAAGATLPAVVRGPFEARGELDKLVRLQERHGLGAPVLTRLIEALERDKVRPELVLARLEELAVWLKETIASLSRATNEDAEARRLKARAAQLLGAGEFEQAMDVLRQVRRHVREARRRIEARLQEEVDSLRTHMAEEALATGRLAEVALARFDYDGAADLFNEAAECLPVTDKLGVWRMRLRQAEALLRKGDERKDATALAQAIIAFSDAARIVTAAEHPIELAITTAGLASAIGRAGERETGIERLNEAAATYRRALLPVVREKEARFWALTNQRLANVLALIAERGGSAQSHREAAEAYRKALEVLTRETATMDWAMAQLGLGNALLGLEESEPGRKLLAEAAQAYAESLTVLSRERTPAEWATAEMNLGNALLGLGELEGLSARLEDAVAAYRQALKVFTRAAEARKWALAQMNLANALASLGDRDPAATSRLEEAIACYGQALEIFTRDTEPLRWAICQMNLGTTLIRLGERKDKRQHWLSAAAAMVPALETFEAEGQAEYADLTRRNLRKFHEQWEQLIGGVAGEAPSTRPRLSAKAR